jgi:mRNA-degrading endonuclease RelE of RelBE toxin-antitoxin system
VFIIEPTSLFLSELKALKKKYPSIINDVDLFVQTLKENPITGTSLGNDCYKTRIQIKSKGKGKSSGARIITYIKLIREKVYLLSIYDKSQRDTITPKEIKQILKISGILDR